jgi:integrase
MSARISVPRYEGVFYRERKVHFNNRPDRTFEICWQDGGVKRWKTIGRASAGVTAADAYHARLALIAGKGSQAKVSAPTVKRVLDYWCETRLKDQQTERSRIKIFAPLHNLTLDELTVGQLNAFKEQYSLRVKPATVTRVFELLSSAINNAIRAGLWVGVNPVSHAAGFTKPVIQNKGERWLTPAEATKLLAALEIISPTWRDMAALSLYTGIRLTELYRLRPRDISAETMTATIWAKGNRREPIQLTPEALEILLRRSQNPDALFFPRKSNAPFVKAVKVCGLNEGVTDSRHRVWFHTLRHTFASWLVQAGVDLYSVQTLLRHRSPIMTQRYAHLNQPKLKASLEPIRRVLSQEITEEEPIWLN